MKSISAYLAVSFLLGCAARGTPAPPDDRARQGEPSAPVAPEPSQTADAPAPAAPHDAGPDAQSLAEQLEAMPMRPIASGGGGPSFSLANTTTDFVAAANRTDDAGARALSTPECWNNECAGFAKQAGNKFQARVASYREAGSRAAVRVEVVCANDRLCDQVELLMIQIPTGGAPSLAWRVADITEDDKKASRWLAGTP